MKCFYHGSDLDGQCSGALIKSNYSECKMFPINYGDDFPFDIIEPNETVFMVDFCLQPFVDMIKLYKMCNLVWIDHHKSAIEDHKKYDIKILGRRKIGIGACQLVWEVLYNNTPPLFVRLLAEYDVWDHTNPLTLPFHYGMGVCKTDPINQDFWNMLCDREMVMRIVEDGDIIMKYQNEENRKYADSTAFEINFHGYRCVVINKMITNSKLFDSVWNPDKHDIMISFGWYKNKWGISLYTNKNEIDVSQIAKKYGGGGHQGAAGFECQLIPFEMKGSLLNE